MLSRKTNVFPLNDVVQDELSKLAVRRALDFPHNLHPGEIVFSEMELLSLHQIQRVILANLCRQFDFARGEVTAHGMVVVRLQPRSSARSGCGSIEIEQPGARTFPAPG